MTAGEGGAVDEEVGESEEAESPLNVADCFKMIQDADSLVRKVTSEFATGKAEELVKQNFD